MVKIPKIEKNIPYESERISFLKTLPKDKDGNPIIDADADDKMWDIDWFVEYLEEIEGISMFDYPDYFRIQG